MKLYELQSPAEIQTLEQQLDRLMASVGLDVEFSRHFVERLLGRESPVTVQEIVDSFAKLKQKYKQRLKSAKKKPGYEAILKDFDSDLNIVFGIKPGKPMPQLTNITIMKKDPDSFVANAGGGEELKVGHKHSTESVVTEMTGFLGKGVQTDDKMQSAFDYLRDHGKECGRQDGKPVICSTEGSNILYGILDDDTLTTIASFRKHPNVDNKKTLEFMFIHTLTPFRNKHMSKRLLWFVKDQEQSSILDYGMQSQEGTNFIKSLGKTQRYDMFWYNTKTGEKKPYEHTKDEVGKGPYRSMGTRTPWRILIEGANTPAFPRFGEQITLGENVLYLYDMFPAAEQLTRGYTNVR